MSVQKNGWVLLDFPRTINQAKLLETMLTGYRQPSDLQKQQNQVVSEINTNFTDPEEHEGPLNFSPQTSFFDSVFLLDTAKDECLRRGKNRKIDPTTNQIFHMEDSPPAGNDQKILDRLQDCYGNHTNENDMIAFVDQSDLESTDNEPMIKQFFSEFGTLDR